MGGQGRTTFWQELARRNVLRVGAAYAVASFAIIEVISNVTPALHLPDWALSFVVVLLALGFPAVLAFSWIYEITPEGLKRTEDVRQESSITHRTGHRLNIVIIVMLVALAGLYGANRFLPGRDVAESRAPGAAEGGISIAVLPFVNLSRDPDQEFFSDGMTEEITSALAKVKGLQVVGRTSAFEFKGQNKDLRTIGQALGATNILEGSIRKEGNRIRVTGQLIRADNGRHIWTENYDRELTSVFAIQDDIARAIAGALQVPLGLGSNASVASRSIDPDSYQQFLRARALYRDRGGAGKTNVGQAVVLLEELVTRAPDYGQAWGLLAVALLRQPEESAASRAGDFDALKVIIDAARAKAQAAAQHAVELSPSDAMSYVALASVQPAGGWQRREELYLKALELEPTNPDLLHIYSNFLGNHGRVKEALRWRYKLLEIEPLVPIYNSNTAMTLWMDGQNEAALALAQALPPSRVDRWVMLANIYASMGRYADAADSILRGPEGGIPHEEAEAAARILRQAPSGISAQEHTVFSSRLSFVYLFVGAPERVTYLQNPLFFESLWAPAWAPVRRTARFKELMRKNGFADYWRARGWPDVCRPVGADDFECN